MFGCAAVQSSEKEEVSQAFAYMQKYHYAPEDYRAFRHGKARSIWNVHRASLVMIVLSFRNFRLC